MKKIVAILMAMLMVMSVTVALAGGVAATQEKQSEKVPVIIMFKDKTDKDLIKQHGGEIKCVYQIKPALAASLPQKAIDALKKNPKIAFIVPDLEIFTMAETLDWGVNRIDADIVHEYNRGTGVKVAIMDTGIDYNHPDLAANYKGGYDFGGLFFGIINDDDPMDFHGHGTHCAGIVAAVKGNDIGVIGVAPEADLYAVKVFDDFGYCLYSDVIEGLEWCINNDIQVISMSFGSAYTAGDPGIEPWINAAYDAGILLVGAAGNDGSGEDTVIYPARYANVIAVAATNSNNNSASFSSTGPTVELSAPGVNIKSTYLNNAYVYMSGTSMACPHVTGTAALALAADLNLSNVKVRKWLRATAEDLGEPGKDNAYGYGLVDAENATSLGANETPPIIKILSPSDGSTYVTINRSLIWITDEACDLAMYSLNDGENVTIAGNTTFIAQNGTNNLILYCKDLEGNIGSATTNFTVDKTILYRFVQITDSHVDSSSLNADYDARIISHSVEILEDTLDEIGYRYDPNTIILTGDITDKGTEEDLQLSENILNERAENWSVVTGNHDVLISLNSFLTVFDERNWSFVDENSGALFIGIDSSEGCGIFNPEGKVSEDQIAFLNGTLSRYPNAGKIAFVFMHHTLQNVGGCLITNAEEVNRVLWSHTGNYRKIVQLCGHVHLNNRTDENNVTYLVTSALVSYPMEYRIVDIRANSINMTMGGPAHPEYANLSLGEGANPANNGTDFDRIVDIDITTIQAPPTITSWYPIGMVVNNTEGEPRTFNITVDQVVNVSWQINGTEVQPNGSVIEAYYTNTSAVIGTWSVSAIASNPNGTAMQTWIWNVIAPDTMLPSSIADLNESEVGETWINWTWTDPADADFSHVIVYIDGGFKQNVPKGVQHYNATGFGPDTEHTIATRTEDTSGNINQTWLNHTAWTASLPDTTPPASITDLVNVTYEQTYINWTWTAPADADFSHVIVYIDGEPKGDVLKGVQHYNATGFGPDTEHTIATRTEDTSSNINQTWVNHTAWTSPHPVEEVVDNVTTADIPVSGTMSGSYVDTNVSDNESEAITEIESKGKPTNRYSYLEHKWTIDVISGNKTSVTFHLEANHTCIIEGDEFKFEYSTNDVTYKPLVTVYKTTDDNENQSCPMSTDISGTVYIRVRDTDRITGHKDLDTIYIDHIFIRSVFGAPDTTPPVITNVTNTTPTHNSVTITWDTDESADSLVKYGTASGSYTMSKSNATSVTSHSIELTELEPNTTYYYVVNSTDPSGNSNESAEYNFRTAEAPTDQMHVASIEMSLSNRTVGKKNTFTHATALVTIVNIATGAPVEGATVEGNWSDATSDSDSGITNSTGQVSLDSDEVKKAASGTTFTFTVDNVTHTDLIWDKNQASGSITV